MHMNERECIWHRNEQLEKDEFLPPTGLAAACSRLGWRRRSDRPAGIILIVIIVIILGWLPLVTGRPAAHAINWEAIAVLSRGQPGLTLHHAHKLLGRTARRQL
jgi:hypothetical protein